MLQLGPFDNLEEKALWVFNTTWKIIWQYLF